MIATLAVLIYEREITRMDEDGLFLCRMDGASKGVMGTYQNEVEASISGFYKYKRSEDTQRLLSG